MLSVGLQTIAKPEDWTLVVTLERWRLNEGYIGGKRLVNTGLTFGDVSIYLAMPSWWPAETVDSRIARFRHSMRLF
jgi:hypothetical protein